MNNKCVYLHKLNNKVVYVGSGSKHRVRGKTERSVEHLMVWDSLEFVIYRDNLSKQESLKLEAELITEYWDTGLLFNKLKTPVNINILDRQYLLHILQYDESSPTFLVWKNVETIGKKKSGKIAGSKSGKYVTIQINGKKFLNSRIIWTMFNEQELTPDLVVDHIDGNSLNNNIKNLRAVTSSDNNRNKIHRLSNTGYQCIREYKFYFRVNYTLNGKQLYLDFSYHPKALKSNPRAYPTRELALEAAINYRNSLVEQGLIILTNKEEINGIN